MILRRSWRDFGSITTHIVYTPRLMTLLHQKCLVKRQVTALISLDISGNHISVVYISCHKLPEYKFAMHRPVVNV
jgi:hypothetical protein